MSDTNELLRSKHAFGSSINIDAALDAKKIDAFDVLFLDGDTDNPKVGWIDGKGNKVIIKPNEDEVIRVNTLPASGEEGKIYIYGEDGYFWDGEKFINLCKTTDVSELQSAIDTLETLVGKKADVEIVETKISEVKKDVSSYTDEKAELVLDEVECSYEKIKYEISHKPVGTIVDYREKEIRVMCPASTNWTLQQSGENADKNNYYIGFKAYAPNEDVVSFKETIGEIITDDTMYYFEGNDYAGIDSYGRKYSIVWLPAAACSENGDWTYYGDKSTVEHYVGWYYSVEWYNADGVVIASDCIRINLSNKDCHSSIVDQSMIETVNTAKTYTDTQIESILSAYTVVEF